MPIVVDQEEPLRAPAIDPVPHDPADSNPAPPPAEVDTQPLFRSAAVNARRTQWLGPVLLVSPISYTVYALLALAAVVLLSSFVIFGQYTRRVTLNGWLVPAQGMVRVFAQQPGVVTAIKVREGTVVDKGAPLIELSAERQSAAFGATQAEITRLLQSRRTLLQNEISQQELLSRQQAASLATRLDAIRAEIEQFNREIALQQSRTEIAKSTTEKLREVTRIGAVSQVEVERQFENELEQRGRLRQLERTRTERQRELVTLKAELEDLPIKTRTTLANLSRDIRALEQELAESEARREVIIVAPQAGTVTAIQAETGGHATTATNLLSIVPSGSPLEAHLFANSKAVGFIRGGQQVQLRYQAFPYQKFGHALGEVLSVSRTSISPSEVPTHLAGLTSLVGREEAIYRVTVRPLSQTINAYGTAQPLQPGMQLESDVLLEKRPLWEWALEPLFTMTGKL